MGTIRKIQDKYRAEIAKCGVRKSKRFKTKAEAQQWIFEEERKIEENAKGGIKNDVLFSDAIIRYQKEVSPLKKTATEEIRRLNRVLSEPIANLYISDITKNDIHKWMDDRRATGAKESSVKRELTILSNIFKYSVERWDYIIKNPMLGVEQPSSIPPRNQRLTKEELDLLAEKSGYNESLKTPRSRCVGCLFFAIETGMRLSEIKYLTWDRVFLDKKIVYLPDTKNGSPRVVPLSKTAIDILKRFEELKIDDFDNVFKVKALTNTFNKFKQRIGLDHITFHDSRREACSRMAKKVDVMTLAKISGHKDIKILLNTYYAPDMSDVADLLD